MNKINTSLMAFAEQIQNWELTLNRQAKKLKQVKKKTKSRFKLNSIQICIVTIDSQLIQYKKIKQKLNSSLEQKSLTSDIVLTQYTISSRRFMDILQKIANINLEEDRQDIVQNAENQNNFKEKQQKSFLGQTFSFKVSKNQNKKKSKSYFENRKNDISISSKTNNNFLKKQVFQVREDKNIKRQHVSTMGFDRNNNKRLSGGTLQLNTSQLSGIKQQLAQIKNLMKEMHNQIVYHDHEQINKELQKMQNNNRKLGIQLKTLKQQNKYILCKIQTIGDILQQEKKHQADMIQKIQKKQNRSSLLSQSSQKNHISKEHIQQENLSDWVKIRI